MLTFFVLLGGCGGTVAWQLGVFNADGRFEDVDACKIMPEPGRLASFVANGAREPRKPERRGIFDPEGSECKWSSVPEGVDRPFRTVRVYVKTTDASSDDSGPERAVRDMRIWRENHVRRGTKLTPIDIGEESYRTVDRASYVIVLKRVDVYDIHAKFRISNAVVDVSARTHDQPGEVESAQVVALGKDFAARLNRLD